MTTRSCHLAFDLGAESGRAIVGVVDSGRLSLHEVHRFAHHPVLMRHAMHWDLPSIVREMKEGLKRAGAWCAANHAKLDSVGVDTWGVDFAILGPGGSLTLPRCYRDPDHADIFPRIVATFGGEAIFNATGIQPMSINTLYQLFAHEALDPPTPGRLLFMPDLLHLILGSEACNEITIASTSQLLDARTATWSKWIMQRACDIDRTLLAGKLVAPGSRIGSLDPELARDAGLHAGIDIIAPACHDTASAVAAIPASPDQSWCYLSSGTWSLMGVELDEPIITEAAYRAGFSNELGVIRNTPSGPRPAARFQKNITGLWMVQECRREFERNDAANGKPSSGYDELTVAASSAEPFRTLLDVSRPEFLQAGEMCAKIVAFAKQTDQPAPSTPGQFVRACLESLALEYRRTLAQLESIAGRSIDVLHIVGGGGKNRLLNQMTADATGKPLVIGPTEATAAGNVLVQAIGSGHVRDVAELRSIVRGSFELDRCEPQDVRSWSAAADRYTTLLRSDG